MQGFVRSFVLVAGGGKVYRIEKTNGITDPAKFNEPGIELIQDDNIFYFRAIAVSGPALQ